MLIYIFVFAKINLYVHLCIYVCSGYANGAGLQLRTTLSNAARTGNAYGEYMYTHTHSVSVTLLFHAHTHASAYTYTHTKIL